MSKTRPDLAELLRAKVEAESGALRAHPATQELESFHAGDLPTEREQAVRDHLTICSECAELILALNEFQPLDELPPSTLSSGELEAAWKDLLKRVREEAPSPVRALWVHALAAVLALAVLGLSFLSAYLVRENSKLAGALREQDRELASRAEDRENGNREHDQLRERSAGQARELAELRLELDSLHRPQINTPVIDLSSRETRSGRGTAIQKVELSPDVQLFIVILEGADERDFPAYTAQILDSEERTLWMLEGLERTVFGNFTMTLPCRSLPPGELRIRLYGVRGGTRTKVEEYALQVSSK